MNSFENAPPENALTTIEMLDRAAASFGDKTFIEENDLTLSFIECREQCRQVAAALIELGFQAGDKAAIWAPNIHQWILAALGTQLAGGTLVTINTRYKGTEAATILRESNASVLFCIGHFLNQDYPKMLAEQDTPLLKNTIIFDDRYTTNNKQQWQWPAFLKLAEKIDVSTIDTRAYAVSADDISDILFTSGTTGVPKGVMTSHAQNIETFKTWTALLGLDANDRYLVINPFFHSFGYKAGILACLMRGTTLLPHLIFDTQAILQRIDRENITMMPGPPTLFQSILADPQLAKYNLSSLTKAATGAAIIPVSMIVKMREQLGIETVVTAYGLTESCGVVTMCRAGDSPEIIAQTSGRAIPGVELRCVDSQGDAVAVGEPGEIVFRGFNVMRGYFNHQQATREAIDEQGWLHTGDIGVLDEAGNLSITDRLKDMFITGGFNCYPAEIENCLNGRDDIAQCAVIGIPDERMGEVAMAWIIRMPNAEPLDEATLISWCRDNMANYKVPRKVVFVESLPLNASGKVLKTDLRDQYKSTI